MTRRSIVMAACVLLAACGGGSKEPRLNQPHIVMVTSDTLRADHLSIFGYPRATSPSLDEFAVRSWHFTDAVTVIPKTGPSFVTLLTGWHSVQHGVRSNFEAIPEGLPVLPEWLKSGGYATAAFVGNPVLREGIGFSRGFDVYRLFDGKRDEGVQSVNQAFFEWADEHDWGRPTFVWIHYMDPHGPYTPAAELEQPFLEDDLAQSDLRVPLEPGTLPSENPNKVLGAIPVYQQRDGEDRAAVYVARYDAEILYMDTAFGELTAFLEERDLYDGAAVIFTSDHGESLGEHDLWFEHGWFAYEPTLHVPLMIKKPGQTTGRVVRQQVSNLDLMPTILKLARGGLHGNYAGTNILTYLEERGPVLIESSDRYPDKYHGVRTSGWKYLVREADGAEELYDLGADPAEMTNLAERELARLEEMRQACIEALTHARKLSIAPASGAPDDPETLERLKALGYVGR